MNKLLLTAAFFLFAVMSVPAQKNLWTLEAESPATTMTWSGATADIVSPKGATLWYRQKMKGDVVVEYDAQVIVDDNDTSEWNRLSDLNCFWMASDPQAGDVFANMRRRGGSFVNTYTMRLYYMGFGGNHNTTTRFRRYHGDRRGVEQTEYRPEILREYTDSAHLLVPNHWYHVRLEAIGGKVRYIIDGQCLVDWADPEPLREGWFGFRTTLSHTQIRNFSWRQLDAYSEPVRLHWIGGDSLIDRSTPTAFGIPFAIGEIEPQQAFSLTDDDGNDLAHDEWNLAYWADGSVKWKAFATVAPKGQVTVRPANDVAGKKKDKIQTEGITVAESDRQIRVKTASYTLFLSKRGHVFIDSLLMIGRKAVGSGQLLCSRDEVRTERDAVVTRCMQAVSRIDSMVVERKGRTSCVIRVTGCHQHEAGDMLPFVLRLYLYDHSPDIKLVHSVVIDSLSAERPVSSLGMAFGVPMRERLYNRHVWLDQWTEAVQPLAARRPVVAGGQMAEAIQVALRRVPEPDGLDPVGQTSVRHLAAWDRYRLSQLSPRAYAIRKAATSASPWVGTREGGRANGTMFVGDLSGGLVLSMKDFWQSYPSSLEVRDARADEAKAILWLWSPEAEPMDLAHYDTIPHTLEAAYEDVQPGMSSPFGVARTSVVYLRPMDTTPDSMAFNAIAASLQAPRQLVCTPEYLHRKRAFGVWSLPTEDPAYAQVEQRLTYIMDYYKDAIDRYGWYGFWNYGDVMHQFDSQRQDWMYDVGGYAWDNTELASNMMFWYNFLRTGRADVWTMAEAMTRHTSEVDAYHDGPNAMLGSRHNVTHWGCGAKEARISQAAWNRFYYYLTADERTGDLMTEVRDADQMLYTLDPMRLAQPRSLYPCTAPARLRIGPDWLAYAANWMTEWERTRNTAYRDKILAGMKSIAALDHGIFSGPKALGFDPATGIITNECDPSVQNTNHLLPIMGGFEVLNELMPMAGCPEWNATWLDFCKVYKEKAWELSKNKFKIPRLQAYAGWMLNDPSLKQAAWKDILRFKSPYSPVTATNDAATWTLDAIYSLEVAK